MECEPNKLHHNSETGQNEAKNTPPIVQVQERKIENKNTVDFDGSKKESNNTNNGGHGNQPKENSVQGQVNDKPGTSNVKLDSTTEEEFGYESEPASVKSFENRQKKKFSSKKSQGKTMYPSKTDRELRELTRKHFILEKNLKIDGIPEPPKLRKRRVSTSVMGRDKDNVMHKRKRLIIVDRPKKGHMPNWGSFGGDATDPLNLNGLADSEEGRMLNLKTPENSPLPTPDFRKIVFVKVPPNIEDPLNLEGRHDQSYINMLLNSTRKKRHRPKKNKDNANPPKDIKLNDNDHAKSATDVNIPNEEAKNTGVIEVKEPSPPPPSLPPPPPPLLPPPKPKAQPSTPQKQGALLNRSRSRSHSTSPDRKMKRQLSGTKGNRPVIDEPKKYPEKPMFTYGNYNRYYGYRNRDHEPDPRLRYFDPQLFENKDVLDIGCNVGHVTLAIAEHFHARKILGMDIDGKLIRAARQNMRHMLSQRRKDSSKYPSVFEMTRGPLEAHPLIGSSNSNAFPNNILFLQGNYVPASEDILRLQKEEYDTILALSITKWIHLNNGDHGIKLFFQKIVRQLRPGGHLILEPQPWSTYRKRAKLTPDMFKNYSCIKIKPEGFKNYLLSIGFGKCEVIGVPVTKAKGFRRPLILFTKTDRSNASSKKVPSPLQNTCTECAEGDQSECDHIQFTGMRRGAYADRMYDHISYNPPSRMSDTNSASYSCSSTGRNFYVPSPTSIAFTTYCPMIDIAPPYNTSSSSPHPPSLSVPAPEPLESSSSTNGRGGSRQRSESGSSSGNGSQSSSSSSSTSTSGHSSSSGSDGSFSEEASSPLVNGVNALPELAGVVAIIPEHHHNGNGDLNGDIAAEIVWVNNEVESDAEEEEMENEDIPLQQENGAHPLNNDVVLNEQLNPD